MMIHHPPVDEGTAPRRRLTDSAALGDVLARAGADLVLHGHRHRTSVTYVPGPNGTIPVVGVRSASYLGAKEQKRAQYHIYRIEPLAKRSREGSRYRIHLEIRGYDRGRKRFLPEGGQVL
jgi:3',5'-cyclic AMP phosphodiesterase CpdA